jgi:hypothetical protein
VRELELCRELSRKFCKDIGATPFSINKGGLTHPDLLVKTKLKISDENGVVKNVPMWYGEARGIEGKTCCLVSALEPDPDKLEIACVIGFKNTQGELQADAVRAAFRYDWANDEDYGVLVMRAGDRWLELSLSQRLQLALGFENMVQDGVLWHPQPDVPEELRKNLSDIIALDEDAEQ